MYPVFAAIRARWWATVVEVGLAFVSICVSRFLNPDIDHDHGFKLRMHNVRQLLSQSSSTSQHQ
jgi:hypothetical protein